MDDGMSTVRCWHRLCLSQFPVPVRDRVTSHLLGELIPRTEKRGKVVIGGNVVIFALDRFICVVPECAPFALTGLLTERTSHHWSGLLLPSMAMHSRHLDPSSCWW